MNQRGAAVLKVLFQVCFGHCLLDKQWSIFNPPRLSLILRGPLSTRNTIECQHTDNLTIPSLLIPEISCLYGSITFS
jgi:hypothetical protein